MGSVQACLQVYMYLCWTARHNTYWQQSVSAAQSHMLKSKHHPGSGTSQACRQHCNAPGYSIYSDLQ